MNTVTTFLNATPWLRLTVDIAGIIIPLSALLAFAGTGFLSAAAKLLFLRTGRAAYDKCAKQLACLGLVLGWLLLTGGRVWLSLTLDAPGALPPQTIVTEACWIFLGAGVLFISFSYALWKFLAAYPVAHALISLLGALQGLAALLTALAAARCLTALTDSGASSYAPDILFLPDWRSPFWNALSYTPLLMLAMSGASGALWLLCRRRYEDFGRDYYTAMILWCAAWARNTWAALWIVLLISSAVLIYQQPNGFSAGNAVEQTVRLLLWLLPALIWTIVCRAKTPLRHKFALVTAFLVAVVFTLPYYLDITDLTMDYFSVGAHATQSP
ncbi:MAG: conserved hypothetical protein [Candidatus Desulfovibrio kirbyi]|uniref:Uncharacterized protein n=1 Tax=Candidatus Desulfovibrio kirbyi TaxID=2696086 RepID=A0A6L2R4E2_9BACT|nr:MAG: conserved hypothetical protein [Candidatus Desulfovibrio kirbyi]